MELLKVGEVAERLRISRALVYRLCATGQLPVVRIGFAVRISAEALEAWLERMVQMPGEEVKGGD